MSCWGSSDGQEWPRRGRLGNDPRWLCFSPLPSPSPHAWGGAGQNNVCAIDLRQSLLRDRLWDVVPASLVKTQNKIQALEKGLKKRGEREQTRFEWEK